MLCNMCKICDQCVGNFLHVVILDSVVPLSVLKSNHDVLFCSMDQVKGVLTLQGEALTQAVRSSVLIETIICLAKNQTLI